jgi:cytidylate kinase
LDHELLERMAAEMHVNVRLLDSIDEQHVPWLVERMEAFSSIPFVSESSYVRQLLDTVLSLAARGECVIVGRGASQILPPALAIRVRLVADFADRARTMMRELSCTLEEAERQVKALDQQRATFIKNHFHSDVAAPENYDLLLNTSRLDIDTCSQIIITVLEDRRRAWSNGAG